MSWMRIEECLDVASARRVDASTRCTPTEVCEGGGQSSRLRDWRNLTSQLAVALIFCLLVAGCAADATLQQVRDLADTVTKSLDSFKSLPASLYDHCIHLAAWNYPPPPPPPGEEPPLFTRGAFGNAIGTGRFSSFSDVNTTLSARSLCGLADFNRELQRWADANTIVIQYVAALNALAGGKSPQLSPSFTDLAKSVKDASFVSFGKTHPEITAAQVVQAGGLLDKAVKAAFAAERARQILTFAQQADQSVGVILTVLYKAASQYDDFLVTEFNLVEGRFTADAKLKGLTDVQSELWYQSIARIEADRRSLNQYVQLLNTIADAQAKLAKPAAYGSPEKLAQLLRSSAAIISATHGLPEAAR